MLVRTSSIYKVSTEHGNLVTERLEDRNRRAYTGIQDYCIFAHQYDAITVAHNYVLVIVTQHNVVRLRRHLVNSLFSRIEIWKGPLRLGSAWAGRRTCGSRQAANNMISYRRGIPVFAW